MLYTTKPCSTDPPAQPPHRQPQPDPHSEARHSISPFLSCLSSPGSLLRQEPYLSPRPRADANTYLRCCRVKGSVLTSRKCVPWLRVIARRRPRGVSQGDTSARSEPTRGRAPDGRD